MNTTKTLSPHAATAKAIRKDLKEAFPGVKFSVRSECYAGGDAVSIGSPDEYKTEVREMVKKYEEGSFDAMTDMYEYDNSIEGLPQVKYVQVGTFY